MSSSLAPQPRPRARSSFLFKGATASAIKRVLTLNGRLNRDSFRLQNRSSMALKACPDGHDGMPITQRNAVSMDMLRDMYQTPMSQPDLSSSLGDDRSSPEDSAGIATPRGSNAAGKLDESAVVPPSPLAPELLLPAAQSMIELPMSSIMAEVLPLVIPATQPPAAESQPSPTTPTAMHPIVASSHEQPQSMPMPTPRPSLRINASQLSNSSQAPPTPNLRVTPSIIIRANTLPLPPLPPLETLTALSSGPTVGSRSRAPSSARPQSVRLSAMPSLPVTGQCVEGDPESDSDGDGEGEATETENTGPADDGESESSGDEAPFYDARSSMIVPSNLASPIPGPSTRTSLYSNRDSVYYTPRDLSSYDRERAWATAENTPHPTTGRRPSGFSTRGAEPNTPRIPAASIFPREANGSSNTGGSRRSRASAFLASGPIVEQPPGEETDNTSAADGGPARKTSVSYFNLPHGGIDGQDVSQTPRPENFSPSVSTAPSSALSPVSSAFATLTGAPPTPRPLKTPQPIVPLIITPTPPRAATSSPQQPSSSTTALPSPGARARRRPSLYQQTSQSMIDLGSPASARPVSLVGEGKGKAPDRTSHLLDPAVDWLSNPPPSFLAPPPGSPGTTQRSLHRVSSMPSMPTYPPYEPPHYDALFPHKVSARELEGKETLPTYSNSIFLAALLPRKMEFSAPGVQARDRRWKKVWCVLEGTSFKVYKVGALEAKFGVGTSSGEGKRPKFANRNSISSASALSAASQNSPSGNVALGGNKSPVGSASAALAAITLTKTAPVVNMQPTPPASPAASVHLQPTNHPASGTATPRSSFSSARPSTPLPSRPPSSPSSRRNSHSSARPAFVAPPPATPAYTHTCAMPRIYNPSPSSLIHHYTLQHAESGLGTDYLKRRNVIRVRMEGEQFLLQAPDLQAVVDWIEGFQAAANIALDLDIRPMPKGAMFPRRRRRRRPRETEAAPAEANTTTATNSNPSTSTTTNPTAGTS